MRMGEVKGGDIKIGNDCLTPAHRINIQQLIL